MMGRLLRRLGLGVLTVLGVYTVTFLMVMVLPGDPLQSGDRPVPEEIRRALAARYDLDQPAVYFGQFLLGAVRLDFGPSFQYRDWNCSQIIAQSLPVSIVVGLSAIWIALAVGVPIGVWSALRRNSFSDLSATAVVLIGISIPTFVTGSVLLTVFGLWLRMAPVSGWGSLAHLPLPALTLSLPFVGYVVRLTRMSMVDALASAHVQTASAKGLARWRVVWRHAFPIAFLPVLSWLGPATAQAVTGSFVVEKVFDLPGMGQHFVNSALNADRGLMLATVLVFSAILVGFNILVDLLYSIVDPRIRGAV